MALRINTNLASITAQRGLATHTESLLTNFRKLSTGLRIATAADDAGRLATSERLRSQIRSLDAAGRNANDAVSVLQIGEGALNETSSILTRMRELAITAANGTTSSQEKNTLNEELQALVSEVNRIAQATQFNGVSLLDGSSSSLTFQIGFGTTTGVDTLSVSLSPALSTSLALNSIDIGSTGSISNAIIAVDAAINTVSGLRGRLAAVQNRLNSTLTNISVASEQLAGANSRIRDVDVADETSLLTRNSVLQQAAVSILAQANVQPQSALSLLR
jgi:flagellin